MRLTLSKVPASQRLLCALLALASGCGDTTAPPPSPPPPPIVVAVTPATATVEAGTSREFTAQVTNATNTAVTWSSSGGTITGTGNTVTWTAPATAGAYTLTASSVADATKQTSANITVPAPASVVVLLENATVGSGGGTLTVNQPTSPLHGLSVLVPAGTYPTPTTWTVAELRDARPTVPPALRQIGPGIRIGNGGGFAAAPFFLTIPVAVGPDSVAGAAYWDPASGTLEPLPVVARTATSLMIMTQHVSADHLLLPAAGALRASAGAAPGDVQIILLAAWRGSLATQLSTTFVPGTDDWEFSNTGSARTPGGYCTGSTLTALYHHYVFSSVQGPLFGQYDEFDTLEGDNRDGIHLASVVQETMNWPDNTLNIATLRNALGAAGATLGGATWARTQVENLALAILTNGYAQQLGIYTQAWADGHAIIAYGVNLAGTIQVADPNYPGVPETIEFTATQITPFDFAARAGDEAQPYSEIIVLGVSALVPMRQMASHWDRFFAGTIGEGYFPVPIIEYRDPVDAVWRVAGDPVTTANSKLFFRSRCPDCPILQDHLGKPLSSDGHTGLFDDEGHFLSSDSEGTEASLTFPDEATYSHRGITLSAPVGSAPGNHPSYLTYWLQDVRRVPFKLLMDPADPEPGDLVTFTVENGGIGTASAQYRWTVGTAAPVLTPFQVTSIQRTMPAAGFTVVVELIDAKGRLARAEASTALLIRFHGLGAFSGGPVRLSRDGSMATGGASYDAPRRWTMAEGVTTLGLTGVTIGDVSDDGTVLVGSNGFRPVRWTAAGGSEFLAAGRMAWGVSGDGKVAVGELGDGFVSRSAFRWTAAGGAVNLGKIGLPSGGTTASSSARAASLDGSVVVGESSSPAAFSEAFRWAGGQMTGLGHLGVLTGATYPYSAATDVSDNGSVVVGLASVPAGYEVFRWSGGSLTSLGAASRAGFATHSNIHVSGDGSTIIFNAPNPARPFIWTQASGVRDLATALQSDFGIDLGGWTITSVLAISGDGRVLVGGGRNPAGVFEAWRAVIR